MVIITIAILIFRFRVNIHQSCHCIESSGAIFRSSHYLVKIGSNVVMDRVALAVVFVDGEALATGWKDEAALTTDWVDGTVLVALFDD